MKNDFKPEATIEVFYDPTFKMDRVTQILFRSTWGQPLLDSRRIIILDVNPRRPDGKYQG